MNRAGNRRHDSGSGRERSNLLLLSQSVKCKKNKKRAERRRRKAERSVLEREHRSYREDFDRRLHLDVATVEVQRRKSPIPQYPAIQTLGPGLEPTEQSNAFVSPWTPSLEQYRNDQLLHADHLPWDHGITSAGAGVPRSLSENYQPRTFDQEPWRSNTSDVGRVRRSPSEHYRTSDQQQWDHGDLPLRVRRSPSGRYWNDQPRTSHEEPYYGNMSPVSRVRGSHSKQFPNDPELWKRRTTSSQRQRSPSEQYRNNKPWTSDHDRFGQSSAVEEKHRSWNYNNDFVSCASRGSRTSLERYQKASDRRSSEPQNSLADKKQVGTRRMEAPKDLPWHVDSVKPILQVAIYREPLCPFTEEQRLEIADAIGDEVMKRTGRGDTFSPRFLESSCRGDYVIVNAFDLESKDWLMRTVPNLQVRKGIKLYATETDNILNLKKARVWIPGKRDLSALDALALLESQNRGLMAKSWKIYGYEPEDCGVRLDVGLDQSSISYLETIDFKPFLKLDRGIVKILDEDKKDQESVASSSRLESRHVESRRSPEDRRSSPSHHRDYRRDEKDRRKRRSRSRSMSPRERRRKDGTSSPRERSAKWRK